MRFFFVYFVFYWCLIPQSFSLSSRKMFDNFVKKLFRYLLFFYLKALFILSSAFLRNFFVDSDSICFFLTNFLLHILCRQFFSIFFLFLYFLLIVFFTQIWQSSLLLVSKANVILCLSFFRFLHDQLQKQTETEKFYVDQFICFRDWKCGMKMHFPEKRARISLENFSTIFPHFLSAFRAHGVVKMRNGNATKIHEN